jgi:hypothetical protein
MMHEYKAQFLQTIDDDTVLLYVDLGFYIWTMVALRISGLDMPQDPTPFERKRAEKAVNWLDNKLENTGHFHIKTEQLPCGTLTADIMIGEYNVNLELERLGLMRGSSARPLGLAH